MPQLTANSYGKSQVRLSKIERTGDRHCLRQMTVDVLLEGDFAAAHLAGDNRQVIATDSMKNTVYVLARKFELGSVEQFASRLANHFVDTYPHVTSCRIAAREQNWLRMQPDDREEHPHAFVGGSNEQTTAVALRDSAGCAVQAGIDGLLILKTTQSGFAGFVRDEFTTLPETDDRIFATELTAMWDYSALPQDPAESRRQVRSALLATFANHPSLSVQHTLYAMGAAALTACESLTQIALEMPNKHHLLVNLSPWGLDNPNVVFQPVDEPFGLIRATVSR